MPSRIALRIGAGLSFLGMFGLIYLIAWNERMTPAGSGFVHWAAGANIIVAFALFILGLALTCISFE